MNIKICEKQILNSIGLPAISYKSNLVRYMYLEFLQLFNTDTSIVLVSIVRMHLQPLIFCKNCDSYCDWWWQKIALVSDPIFLKQT